MLLVIDAGNTNTIFAVFDKDKLIGSWRLSTEPKRTADEHGLYLTSLLQLAGIAPEAINAAIIASVVPHGLFSLRSFCRRYFNTEPLVVGEKNVNIGIEILLPRRSEVGADRLVNAVAAYSLQQQAAIIVDFGTATTFDVINGKGDYTGGVIAPGINLSVDALHRAAAKLPEIAIEKPRKVIGTSTISAMQSGIYWGYVGLIEGIISRIRQEYGQPLAVMATGGLSSLFSKAIPAIERREPDLTILGLKEIYKRNQK